MKITKSALAIATLITATSTMAAGPLYTTEGPSPVPFTWDTTNGPLPVYTDGGKAFTLGWEGEVFLSIERANEITQFAFDQWNNVETSTFEAKVKGTIEEQIGIADVTGANALEMYGKDNGGGFYVLYDTDGSILEDFFGAPKSAVLGIAFPERADANGNITEATALINGWNVWDHDTEGNLVAGVFTHEFGHAINLSHSQTNGTLGYQSYSWAPQYPGIEGCNIDPVFAYDNWEEPSNPEIIETMFPYIVHSGEGARAQSTINVLDDRVSISNLYPTADYAKDFGSIEGTLRLKDGQTEYSGINIIARNISDPLMDAVSAQTGNLTQGKVGPDGYFKINGLTPGQEYVLYTQEIYQGGYPTQQTPLVSVAEYWNAEESSNPASDNECNVTPIMAKAGETQQADFTFNGYHDGIEFRPIVNAHLTDLAKNGRSSMGTLGGMGFTWEEKKGFTILPDYITVSNGKMNRNGTKLLVNSDIDGNGISAPAIWSHSLGPVPLGDLTGNQCGGSGQEGMSAADGWDIDDAGNTVVGLAYKDVNGNGYCTEYGAGELVPFIWTPKAGMHELDTSNVDWNINSWVRAHAISGNGDVALGSRDGWEAVAWVNEGEMVDLHQKVLDKLDLEFSWYTSEVHASNYDGTKVAVGTWAGTFIWDHTKSGDDELINIGGLQWCTDIPYLMWGQDLCTIEGADWVHEMFGQYAQTTPFDMNDDGSVIIGRSGDFWAGFVGAIYIDTLGWMTMDDFFVKQGVAEAKNSHFNNPASISGTGSEIVGGIAGAYMSYHVNMDQVYVCEKGKSVKTGFPNGMLRKIKAGAEFGRCEHIAD